jgi:hypothetical protein
MSRSRTRRDVVKAIGAATIAVGIAGCLHDDDDDDGVSVEEEGRSDGLDGETSFGPEERRQAAAE